MAVRRRHDKFSLGFRIRWWIEYGLLHIFGPATLDDRRDPRAAMRREYARRRAADPRDPPTADETKRE